MAELDDDREGIEPEALDEDAGDPAAAFDALRRTIETQGAKIAAGSPGSRGVSLRPMPNSRPAVKAKASAYGARTAHSLRPNRETLPAIAQ